MSPLPSYRIVPIRAAAADELRVLGGEICIADEHPGYPCRQCLTDALVGEELLLVSHDPFDAASTSPYRSASPIFIHVADCKPSSAGPELPTQLTSRQLSVRAFDTEELMIDADVIDGVNLDQTLGRFFSAAAVDHVHIHNATRGCWAAKAVRSAKPSS